MAHLVLASSIYGAVLGSWHGSTLAFFAAVKLPLVLLVTSLLTAGFQHLMGRLLGLDLRYVGSVRLALGGIAHAALLLGGLVPAAALFVWCAPAPDVAARTTHNLLYLMHTTAIAVAGCTGAASLRRQLAPIAPDRRTCRLVFALWIASFGLVGSEVSWALRPFVGSVYEPVTFLRADALDGNVFEFIWTDILPHLTGTATKGGAR